jgi:transposase
MIDWSGRRVFVYQAEIDMRRGFSWLAEMVRGGLQANIMDGDLFLFLGKNARRVKVILFDGTGLVLVSKRLEKGRFQRLVDLERREEVSLEELRLIFQGTRINFVFQRKDFSLAAPSQIHLT